MAEAFPIGGARAPIGRYGGARFSVRPDDLTVIVIKSAVERAGIDPDAVDEVIFGARTAPARKIGTSRA